MWRGELAELAARQHGIIERGQALALAPSPRAAHHELGQPHWQALTSRVFRSRAAVATDYQRLTAALLRSGAGSIVSHHSAAGLWGIAGYDLAPHHVTRTRGTNSTNPPGMVVHRVRSLPADQITQLQGLPVTRPERIPFDLANVGVRPERIERVIDALWTRRLVSGRSLHRVYSSLPARGWRGKTVMRELLDARPADWVPPASGLESRALYVLERNGFPNFRRQVDLGSDTEWLGRVDFFDDDLMAILEVQSDEHHASVSNQRDDERRLERFRAAGYHVVQAWESEVWHRPERWLEELRTIARQRDREQALWLRSAASAPEQARRSSQPTPPQAA